MPGTVAGTNTSTVSQDDFIKIITNMTTHSEW